MSVQGGKTMHRFVLTSHSRLPGVEIVEVWRGSDMVAVIYPSELGIKVVSKHLRGDDSDIEIDSSPPVPAILINFDPE